MPFECTGATPALRDMISVVKPRAAIVQVGVAGEVPIPIDMFVGKEIRLVGTQRFRPEFPRHSSREEQ